MPTKNFMISVITPSLNQARFLEENILSVLDQNFPDFEHIVIDGGSSDGSINILKKYNHLKWISEKDNGQANAINKGFKMAKGDIIGWLNSDDVYRPDTFPKVNNFFLTNPEVDFIFSFCLLINAENEIIGFGQGKDPQKVDVLTNTNFIPQPTVFFRKTVFSKTGYLDERYSLAMDIDYWRRIAKNHEMRLIKDIFACFRIHNESKTSKYLNQFKYQARDSFFRHGGSFFSPYYFETFIKPRLMKLFIHNPLIKRLFFHGK